MQRILKKSSLIFSITGALLGGFLMFSSPAYGVSILPVDTLLQQAYLRQQNNDFSSMSKSLSQEGNIYDSAYKFAKKNALQAAANAFSNVANNLNSKYTCSLTPSDIGNVAANDAALNAAFAGLIGKQSVAVDSQSTVKSCVRIAQCALGQKANSAAEMTRAYTSETFPLCRQIVQESLTNTMSISAQQTTLDNANRGDDMFFNGTLDDSPYDLLLDMQLIGDVLFKSNTAAPQVILYDFPGAGGNTNSNFTFFDPTGNGGTNLALNTNNRTSTSASAGNPSSNTNTTSSTSSSPTSTTSSNTTTNSNTLQQLSSYHQKLQNGSNTSRREPSNSTSLGSTSNGLVCVTPTTTTTTPTLTEEQIAANETTLAMNLENALSTYNNAINAPQAIYETLRSPELQGNTSFLTSISNLGNSSANGNNGNSADPNSAANSCLSKCDPLAPADKAICQAKCLCGSQYSDNGIFGISVCTVPTSQTEVIGGKTVKTVEEIVDEINTILTALRNSGQLMKHTKTKEFLDTSLSKIKLNQILSFDMNVAFKPMYDSNLNRTKKQAQKSQNDAIADRARQGSYTDSKVGEEKNKYIIFTNPIKTEQAASTLSTEDSTAQSTTIDPTLPYDLAKTLNNDMINSISSFMDQNALLREQVGSTLNAINTTSTNLEKKIQKGK